MRLLLIYCGGTVPPRPDPFSVTFDDTFAERFLRHLVNEEGYCNGCGALCDHCRDTYGIDYTPDIADVIQLPPVLPYYLDDPAGLLGRELPPHEATVAINVHQEILLALPDLASRAGSRVIIAPSEAPGWVSRWVRGEVRKACRRLGMGCSFPKPFCSLAPGIHPAVDEDADEVTLVAQELALFLSSQYRVALVGLPPRKGVLISRSPKGNWASWVKRGGPLPQRERFLVKLPAPVKRIGSPSRLMRRVFPQVQSFLGAALQEGRLDFVIADGDSYIGANGALPGRRVLVSPRPEVAGDVRTRWEEGQPQGKIASIPDMPALIAACKKRKIPLIYAAHRFKRAFWELAVNLFSGEDEEG
ncbi:MAG: DUF166 family protein [Actinomycetota bacterium]